MQHHEEELSLVTRKTLEKLMIAKNQAERFGATGKFPDGKLSETDEGELFFGVTVYHGQVILNFGKPIRSAGFSPDQARQLAQALRRRANEIERNPDL